MPEFEERHVVQLDHHAVWLPGQWFCQTPAFALLLTCTLFLSAHVVAEEIGREEGVDPLEEVVSYAADFFDRYQPNTALDMVNRLPGFQIDNGGDKRGFGGASGNILINDRYPSSKQDSPSGILERIPAAQVRRIKLIRGQSGGVDLRGHSAVASIILLRDMPATTRYEVAVRKNFMHSPLTPRASISLSDQWRGIEYNAGVGGRRYRSQELGPKQLEDVGGNVARNSFEDAFLRGKEGSANLNLSTWLGETLLQANTEIAFDDRKKKTDSSEASAPVVPDNVFVEGHDQRQFEFGVGAERDLQEHLLAKAIALYIESRKDALSSHRELDSSGAQALFRLADTYTETTEGILRFEFDWTGWADHAVQLNIEGARNVIDNSLVQTIDSGGGPVLVPVPGANTRVQEDRGDILLSDTWFFHDLEVDYGIGAEISTISQTGDAVQKRRFSFFKPQVAVTWSPSQSRQTRIRLAREVSQLNFQDFVSSTVFRDDDLALGNPDLQPESTWVSELSEERRFGALGVVKLTLFHHWISDVEDLLPVTSQFEVPGNIGNGRRWGLDVRATIPFEYFGLVGARFDIEARLQDSSVDDPVSGSDRVLSGDGVVSKPLNLNAENRYGIAVNFRHDNEAMRVAWGWEVRNRGPRARYKVNELELYDDGTELNLFLETSRWFGQKIRLSADNMLDLRQLRRRTLYSGRRELSPVAGYEVRDINDGRRIIVTVSGSF